MYRSLTVIIFPHRLHLRVNLSTILDIYVLRLLGRSAVRFGHVYAFMGFDTDTKVCLFVCEWYAGKRVCISLKHESNTDACMCKFSISMFGRFHSSLKALIGLVEQPCRLLVTCGDIQSEVIGERQEVIKRV